MRKKYCLIGINEVVRQKYSLIGINGNAYCVMGYVERAMREVGMSKEEINKYKLKAMSSDYNNLLRVSFDMIDACNKLAGND